ncbi:hypothetical protein ABEB36_012965 [Hypothenemus hampei]|uniref:Uncharacterized protein n=2 Tax=Hypothenemus hampei TaxID=57062 RepID=A0ABD1E6C8_HYPHA
MVAFPISLAISKLLIAVMIIIRRSSVVTMSWVAVSAVDEMIELVRGLVLSHTGIPLDLLEHRFWAICGGEEALRGVLGLQKIGLDLFTCLLELFPSILVYQRRVYLAGVDEDSDDDHWDSDYFVGDGDSTDEDSADEGALTEEDEDSAMSCSSLL